MSRSNESRRQPRRTVRTPEYCQGSGSKTRFGREYNQQAISRERGLWVELAAGLLAEIRDKAQHCGPLCHAHRPRLLFHWAERVSLTGVVFALFNGTPYACRRTLHLLCAMKESTALHRRSGLGKQTSPRFFDILLVYPPSSFDTLLLLCTAIQNDRSVGSQQLPVP